MNATDRLCEPFDSQLVEWKPTNVKGDRCLALPYVDARVVMDRLDAIFGPAGWQDSYKILPSGAALCKLMCLIGGTWVTKMDVGAPSSQDDEGDRQKAAVSDAIKRTAVKFGIGRYLYRLPKTWVDYDARERKLDAPLLPDWALPWVSDVQAGELLALLEATHTDLARFCHHLEISRPEHLPAHRFAETMQLLHRKQSQQGQPSGPANGAPPAAPAGRRK